MISAWVRKLLHQSRNPSSRTQHTRRRKHNHLRFEHLEDRRMMAFTTPLSFATGSNPAGIAVGDFNSDSRNDMAVVNSALAGSVSVLMSNGDGTFAAKVDYPSGANSLDASAGDFNGDGKIDLAVLGTALEILLGNGDGTFGAPLEYPATASAHSVKVADFNNDGKLDVGTMNVNSSSVMLGNGDGTFQLPLVGPVAGNNINLVVGDFNRDGKMDIATSNTASIGTINVLRGRGDGTFDPNTSYYAFTAPVYLGTGDFNNDGYLDFACPNSYAATSMSVLLNNGDGTYGAPHTYGISQTGYEIEVADFNNDGNQDFAVRGASMYMVSHGKGDGTFYPSVNYPTPAGRFEAGTHGDFNGDGAMDLAYPGSSGVTVLTNDHADAQNLAGAVTFRITAPTTTTSGSVLPMTISAVDANGDIATGFRGMVYISSTDPAASTAAGYAFNPTDAGIPYLFTAADAGTHAFTGAIRLVTGGIQAVKVAAPNMTPASVSVQVTGQVAQLQVSAPTLSSAGDRFDVTVSAIDTLGDLAPAYSATIHFSSSDVLAGLPADYMFTPADAGKHTFSVTLKTAGSMFLGAVELGGTIHGGTSVTVSPLAASSLSLAGAAGAIGVARPFTVVAHDVYGNQASAYNGTVHFTSSDSAAILPSDLTLSKGVATADVKFLTVGMQTLTATDVADSTIAGTVSSDATPPVANSFSVTGNTSTIAGTAISFTVRVIDTIGQTASGYVGTVSFSSSDVQAGLPASYTFTSADAGVHTFTATLKTAGIQTLTAIDNANGLLGTQSGIGVSANSFSRFMMSVPNGADSKGHILVTAGEAIQLKVRAVDEFGNATQKYIGTVALSSTDSAANVADTYTFSASDGGEHIFVVHLVTATVNGQSWSFLAADTADPLTQSSLTNFEVINGAASLVRLAIPANLVAGQAFVTKLTVVDAFGNTAKNYFGTIHFASTSLLADLPPDYAFNSTDLGVHEFSLSLNTAGIQSLTAVDSNDSRVFGSEPESVAPAEAVAFAVSANGAAIAGSPVSLTVTAKDAYGNTAIGYRGSVTFSSSDMQSALPTVLNFGTKEAGSATVNVTLRTAGSQSVHVIDSVNASIAGSIDGIDVQAASAAGSFAVTGFPNTIAGVAQAFTVKAYDPYGNFTPNYTGTIHFSSSDGQALLPAGYTFTPADAGVHTFTAILRTAGTHSITANDAAMATSLGTQSGIAIQASTASMISISGFATSTAGATGSFVVSARDAYGNISTSYTGTVSFSSSDAKAILPRQYTFSASDAGMHVFTAILKTAGIQSIFAADTMNGLNASQTGISVSAAAAVSFSMSAPSTVTQGVGFKVTLTALDAFGNIATGYLGKVTLTSSDPKGGKTSYTFSKKDAGVASLSFTLSTLGIQKLSVVDVLNGALTASIQIAVVKK